MDFLIKAAQLLLSLSLLVVLHEFGHYLTARAFKIRVEKFYLFFNPWFSIVKKKIGDTEWGIGWLPLGGYVKISGMIDESMDKEQMEKPPEPWEFRSKPAWQRLIVMVGGVVVNLILGFFIYMMVLFFWGQKQIDLSELKAGLTIHPYLEQYDLHSGDNILEASGNPITNIGDINKGLLVRDYRVLKVQKQNGEIKTITLPEGIDYEIFENGAFPSVGLRHKSITVNSLVSTNGSDDFNLSKSDLILKINGTDIDAIDFSSSDLFTNEKYTIDLTRGEDTLSLELNPSQFEEFLNACPALTAGIKQDDKIISINNRAITFFDEIQSELYHSSNKNVDIVVLRNNDSLTISVPVTTEGHIGFSPKHVDPIDLNAIKTVHYSFGQCISRGIHMGYMTLSDYAGQMKFLFTEKGVSSMGGFGTLGGLFPSTWNWQIFWLNTALISIILAFMNILPIPALDGGHVVFLLYEMITGKEAPQKVLEYAQYVGFFLILGLVVYANGNDIYRWLAG
ncbi:MAG: site-2 protease family protein [Crocinitomicaceae bacterium]|nr:site-2 protease family protein [Crocinitomicaceae bacterium]